MTGAATKLVFLVFDQGVEPDVMEALEKLGLSYYTRWGECSGSGETGIKQGTPIWPGINTVMMIVMPTEMVAPLTERLHAVRDSFPVRPGLKIIVSEGFIV